MIPKKHISKFSTKYTLNTLPFWVYTYVQNGSVKDSIYFFHNVEKELRVILLEEPYIFDSHIITLDEFNSKFKYTPVKLLSSYYGGEGSNLKAIESNENFTGTNIQRIYFPMFFLYFTLSHTTNIDMLEEFGYRPNIKKHYTFLVNQPRPHRLIMLDYFSKYNLLDSCIYSYNSDLVPSKLKFYISKNYNYEIESFDFKQYSIDNNNGNLGQIPHNACSVQGIHTDSVIHIASETVFETVHYTEKTFVPLLIGKPVIIHGGQYANKKLEEFGYKLHTDIIDYSFDSEPDMIKRTELLSLELKRLKNIYTTTELYYKLKDIASENRKNSISIFTNKKYIPTEFLKWDEEFKDNHIWQDNMALWYNRCNKKIKDYEKAVTEVSEGSMGKQVKAESKE